MNQLSQRIKEAKRELTNLKTAHRRGIGNLRIYNKLCEGIYTGSTNPITITINFDSKFAPYPFFQIMKNGNFVSSDVFSVEVNVTYSNNGYTAVAIAYDTYAWALSSGFYILSTAPVTSVTYHQ